MNDHTLAARRAPFAGEHNSNGDLARLLALQREQVFVDLREVMQLRDNRPHWRVIQPRAQQCLAEFPTVPTTAEVGLPAYRLRTWYGVFAPAGTPSAIVNRLHAEIARAVQSTDSKAKLVEMGMDDSVTPTPEDFAAMVRSELEYFAKLVKEAGIKLTE
jgi:hypothetical protein